MVPAPVPAGNKGNGTRNLRDMMGPNINTSNNAPPGSSRSPTSTATLTQKKRAPPQLTTSEIIALNNEVNNATSGKAYPERTALAINGKPEWRVGKRKCCIDELPRALDVVAAEKEEV
ncbi:hypothetical protein EDD22DRAFT_850315 [Suillus occidentalis]|nr:hypothetical protein EDD22DRAFT_850315 [Suillus occidentalis]